MNVIALAPSLVAVLAFAMPGWSAETGPLADRDIDKSVDGDFIVHGDVDHVNGTIRAGGDIIIEGHIKGGTLDLHGERVVVRGSIEGVTKLTVAAHGHCDLGPIRGHHDDDPARETHVTISGCEVAKIDEVRGGAQLNCHAFKRIEVLNDVQGHATRVRWWALEFIVDGHRNDDPEIHKENWGDFKEP